MTIMAERDLDLVSIKFFTSAMIAKMDKKRAEGHGGWRTASAEKLLSMLIENIIKGDPVDVANLCMMLHRNGQSIVIDTEHKKY